MAHLFYNMASRTIGLVGLWDVVAFDEVAGVSFKDKDGLQIMKDFMASGSFAQGRDAVAEFGIDGVRREYQPADRYVGEDKSLLAPFPDVMIDLAFFDRFHTARLRWRREIFRKPSGLWSHLHVMPGERKI